MYSVVCAPGVEDSDGEVLTAEEIRHAQQRFMEKYQYIDKDHDYAKYSSFDTVGDVVESYITETDMTKKALNGEEITIPANSWIIGIKVTNDTLLNKIKDGTYPGVSVTAVPAAAKSKTLIRDLGEGWVAKTVSIVQEPANPIALFFAIKEKGGNEKMVDYKNFYETIASAIKQVSEEKEEKKDIEEESTKAEEEIKEDEEIVDKSCDDKKVSKAEEEPSEDEEVEKAEDFEKKVDEKADMMVSEDELESKIDEAIREKEAINKMVKDLDARLSAIEETLNKSDKIEETEEEVKEEVSEKAEEEVKEKPSESKEEDEKDKKIAELEAKIKELENKTASKSKSLSINNNVAEKQKSVSLYEKLGRDCMGRKL